MSDKFNIENEPFIPEGLEFKQEYMDDAFALYGAAKRRLWWRKFYVCIGVVAFLITGAIVSKVIFIGESSANVSASEGGGSLQTGTTNKITSSSTSDSRNESEDAASRISKMDETSNVQNDRVVVKKSDMDEKSGNPRRTFDHGGSESSGSESPGQGSVSPETKDSANYLVESNKETKSKGQRESKETYKKVQPEIQTLSDRNISPDAGITNAVANGVDKNINGKINSSKGNLDRIISKPAEWAAPAVNLERTGLIPIIPRKRWDIFFTAGLSPLAGYGSSNKQWKPDLIVAAGVEYKLHRGLSLSVTGRYYSISGITHPYLVEHTTYGQGFRTTTETYFTDRLHYAGINANISKSIHLKHQFSFGYSMDYLIAGNNRIVSTELSSFENRDLGTRKAKGFVEGFESMNHSLRISYQYWLGNNKALGISYQHGLTDITKQEYFKRTDIDRNSLLSVYFRMNLTK